MKPPAPPRPHGVPGKGYSPFRSECPALDQMVDPRFASNEYRPYDYADRAHRDLSVTKGKGFTKEKNKKKRGKSRARRKRLREEYGSISPADMDEEYFGQNDYDDYDYGGSSSKKTIFSGSYYGGYSPFRSVFWGYKMSSWIMKVVIFITAIVVIYIIIDYIRSKRD